MALPLAVGTGLVALDVVFRGDESTPLRKCAGGTCGNVLAILSFLGWRSAPIAKLAPDHAGAIVRADLATWGVDTRFLGIAATAATPVVVQRITQDETGRPYHRYSWTCPCCGAWLPRFAPVPARAALEVQAAFPHASVFFFDRPSLGAVAMANNFRSAGALVIFEPSGRGDPEHFEDALAVADIVKYSEERFHAMPRHKLHGERRLEIQTLGSRGLRYRIGSGRKLGAWRALPALLGSRLIDTSGSGDWCTAGLLSKIGIDAAEGFRVADEEDIERGLRFGQALATWNCEFEGARGGMYERTRRQFHRDITELMRGSQGRRPTACVVDASPLSVLCPACPRGTTSEQQSAQRALV